MRASPLLLTLLLATTGLAGCLGGGPDVDLAKKPARELLQAATEPLWFNPQNFPHPAFGYPTLTNPAVGPNVPAWWKPIDALALPKPIQGIELVGATGDSVPSGAGMALFGSLAVVPGASGKTHIVDISDPAKPTPLSAFSPTTRGTDTIAYPDGRLVAVFATDNDLLYVFDLSEPENPVQLATIQPTTTSHKVNVVPGTPIVYNANSQGGGALPGFPPDGITEIYDLTDPETPVHVQDFKNGYGCHHIYFYIDSGRDLYRAYCAGIEVTQIWDIADPRNPRVVVTIPVHHGRPGLPPTALVPVTFSHFSIPNRDATVLIVGDEMGGGALAACTAHAETPLGGVSAPTGALWFYDITDEQNPVLQGWFSPPAHLVSNPTLAGCTAHHGRLVPDPDGRDLLAMAYYGAGVVLVDFSDPMAASIVDQWNDGTNTWEAWYYNGYVFTGDLARGLDALKFV